MWWWGRAAAFVGWFVVWTLAELLVNITRLLCLTAVVAVVAAAAVVGVGWGDDPSETTFRISQSLFFLLSDELVCNSSALGLFSND